MNTAVVLRTRLSIEEDTRTLIESVVEQKREKRGPTNLMH